MSENCSLLKLHVDMQSIEGGNNFLKNQLSKMIIEGYYGYLKKIVFSMLPECRYVCIKISKWPIEI